MGTLSGRYSEGVAAPAEDVFRIYFELAKAHNWNPLMTPPKLGRQLALLDVDKTQHGNTLFYVMPLTGEPQKANAAAS